MNTWMDDFVIKMPRRFQINWLRGDTGPLYNKSLDLDSGIDLKFKYLWYETYILILLYEWWVWRFKGRHWKHLLLTWFIWDEGMDR